MSSFSNSTPLINSSLSGIREQILANAATLYPQEVFDSASWQTLGVVKPQEIFQVVVIGSEKMRAMILCGGPTPKITQQGPFADSAHTALCGLLSVTCEALAWYTETLLGTMNNQEECANGTVDHTMIVEGYHFAAEQRIVATLRGETQGLE